MASKKSPVITKEHKYVLNNTEFTLVDYSFSRSVIDDQIYGGNFELWKQIPRGKCEVFADGELIHTLQGLRKFGDSTDVHFGVQASHELVQAWPKGMTCVSTVKENGECFHLSAFMYKDKLYLIVGSKLVHILIDYSDSSAIALTNQLDRIAADQPQRTSYAVKMTKCLLEKILPQAAPQFVVWLTLGKFTLVGEYLNPAHEHVIQQPEETIKFYAITQTQFDETSPYVCIPFLEGHKLLQSLGVPVVNFQFAANVQELKAIQQSVLDAKDTEGSVEYYLTDHRVVMMYKFKSKHYSVLRTIREIFNSNIRATGKLRKRLQTYHIPVAVDEISEYCRFYAWLVATHKPETTVFSSKLFEEFCSAPQQLPASNDKKLVYLMMVGIPGCGKSTLGSQLMMNAIQNGVHAVYVDQDLYNRDAKQFFAACDKYSKTMIAEQEISLLINGRCNTTEKMRLDSLGFIDFANTHVVYIVFDCSIEDTFYTQRIEHREYHTTLFADKSSEVVAKFKQTIEDVDDAEARADGFHIVRIDPQMQPLQQIQKVWKTVQQCFTSEPIYLFKPMKYYANWICCKYIGVQIDAGSVMNAVKSLKKFNECQVAQSLRIPPSSKNQLHVTLVHSNEFTVQANAALLWSCMVGEGVEVVLKSMHWNQRICALQVHINGANKPFLHITFRKLSHKVENVESNEFIKNVEGNFEEPFEQQIKLIGLVKRY
jgi:tRNA splicing ligase